MDAAKALAKRMAPQTCNRPDQPAARRREEDGRVTEAEMIGVVQRVAIATGAGKIVQDLLVARPIRSLLLPMPGRLPAS